jgi:hypothetical protein
MDLRQVLAYLKAASELPQPSAGPLAIKSLNCVPQAFSCGPGFARICEA